MKILNIEARSTRDALPMAKKLIIKLKKYKTIGLVSTVQHLDGLATIRNYFDIKGKNAIFGAIGKNCVHKGQVLGCDVSSAKAIETKVDAFVFLGTGRFHPLAIAVSTEKPVFIVNPYLTNIEQITKTEIRKYLNKKIINISKVNDAKNIGILTTVKPGQNQLTQAIKLRKKLDAKGKSAFVFIGDTLNPESMRDFSKIDAWINTCCPRMAEDVSAFGRPIANWFDLDLK